MRTNLDTESGRGIVRRRIRYPAPIATMPSVLLIDVAPANRGGGLALGHYYPIIVENDDEWTELDAFLAASEAQSRPPDLLYRRPSMLRSDAILVLRYEPPAPEWPWLNLVFWPPEILGCVAVAAATDMARGCYTMEAYHHQDALIAGQSALLAQLAEHGAVNTQLVAADTLASPGSA